ncbi:MAG: glycosyltransferase family 1 protein [Acutalibacteraceae bacterium]|nr:glycosyltransferase family 1 protein [Acutalibacteraceae bacterium]
MEPIRVLHNIVLMDAGGIETLVMNVYKHIDRERLLFDFLVHRPQEGVYDKEILEYGGKIFRTCPFNPLHINQYKKECMQVFAEHPEYKVFHAHQELCLWPLQYAKQMGVPTRIAHSHNAKSVINLKYFFFLYEKMFIKNYCTDMFMCSPLAGEWTFGKKAVSEGKVKFIKGNIETERFKFDETVRREVREELGVGDRIVIGHVGRFMQQKNHTFLLDIFSIIHKKNPNTVLVLCGNGRLEDDIKQKAKDLGIENAIIFTGVKNQINVQTNRLYQAFDLYLFPSLWEGLPLTGIEAQTSGLPVLMSDVIADETVATNNVTKLSLTESAQTWADKALDIVTTFQRKDCQKQVVDAGFDVRNTADYLQEFYIDRTLRARHNEKNM